MYDNDLRFCYLVKNLLNECNKGCHVIEVHIEKSRDKDDACVIIKTDHPSQDDIRVDITSNSKQASVLAIFEKTMGHI